MDADVRILKARRALESGSSLNDGGAPTPVVCCTMRGSSLPLTSLTISSFLSLLSFLATSALAQPASLPFSECTAGNAVSPAAKINVTTVYGQIVTDDILGRHLNLTVIGVTGQDIIPISNDTGLQTTIFTSSTILSISVWDNSSFFCSSLRPPSPLPSEDPTNYFCPVAAGPIAFSAAIPFKNHDYELLTIDTRLRVVDTSSPANELACIDVSATPLDGHRTANSLYGPAIAIFWVSVGLAIAYWVVAGVARLVAAWGRGGTGSGRRLWSRVEGAGYILASAISGERFSSTPALLRFATPSMRDIIFHTQLCAALGMVAVQWPVFAYPLLAQTGWAMLTYNITITQGSNAASKHWNPLTVQDFNPPSNFADQLSDSSSWLFVNSTAPNLLLMLPNNTSAGIASFAAAVGLRPQDLFGVCMVLFLAIALVAIIISLAIWGVDHLGVSLFGQDEKNTPYGTRGPAYISPPKENDKTALPSAEDDGTITPGHVLFRSTSIPLSSVLGRSWWRYRIRPNSFHGSILHGNLVRILMLFHLPVTIYSCYQFTNAGSQSSIASVVLACLSFAVFSVGLPIFLVLRLYSTATTKLYDETRTLMMLGPLYNFYGQGSQLFAVMFFAMNLIYGITIGCGQKSGTAQAIVILATEVGASLGTSIWLPWGRGASMGLISFFFCVGRTTVAVLLVILTPTVSVGNDAAGWVATAILFILGLIYLGFLMILSIKIIEALIRIIARIPYDRSRHSLDSGLLGVLGLLGCCRPRRRNKRRSRRPPANDSQGGSSLGSKQYVAGPVKNTTPRSSIGPPSVLRPEHALRPYREDSDDESGYIMGSWQPFPQPGYAAVEDAPSTPVGETPPKSGFARVGGGRAHYDSPYAIQTNSTATTPKQEFPSMERIRRQTPSPPLRVSETPTNRSTVTVNHQVSSGLPPGAMSPARPTVHVRTKSQSAIVEDASVLFNLQAGSSAIFEPPSAEQSLRPPQIPIAAETDDSSSDAPEPKRNHWFNFRKARRLSEIEPTDEQQLEEGGRSFVVIRDKRLSAAQPSDPKPEPSTSADPGDGEGQRSFVVLRGNNTS